METLSTNLQLARLVGVQGTPATIIGDEMIPGAVSWETLEAVVRYLPFHHAGCRPFAVGRGERHDHRAAFR